ncbi:replication-associated recombination protein A [Glaciecola sp. 1036]|uniref:replication-associated recombination protein A n=1 Tax=Alteromonadaceae TaxID=72275 RepID=UPI003D046412
MHNPLANLLRPKHLADYAGQEHIVGSNGFLTALLKQQKLPSMILYGPPGCGKTSLAHVVANEMKLPFTFLSAINAGVKDIKRIGDANSDSLIKSSHLLIVDEIHRFNKSQQDALLPYVESGDIILIGATTENPAFSINNALLSRVKVLSLKPLDKVALNSLIDKALNNLGGININAEGREALLNVSNGDARKLLSTLEVAVSQLEKETSDVIDDKLVYEFAGETIGAFSKGGDEYYDLLSAFHKSIRGSSVDGGLFWFSRLLLLSTDIVPICRRLLAIASEDIGNADPKALTMCLNAWDIYHRVGQAEGERAVAQAVIYCALAPKSNAVYNAFKKAQLAAKEFINSPVPLHLRNAPTKFAKEQGHGEGYAYAHNFENAYVPNYSYLPEDVDAQHFYKPNERGFEKTLLAKQAYLEQLDQYEKTKGKA